MEKTSTNFFFDFRQRFDQKLAGNRQRARIDLVERVVRGMPVLEHRRLEIDDIRRRYIPFKKWVVVVRDHRWITIQEYLAVPQAGSSRPKNIHEPRRRTALAPVDGIRGPHHVD